MHWCNVIIILSTFSLLIFQTGTEFMDVVSVEDISGIQCGVCDFLTDCNDPMLSTERLFLSMSITPTVCACAHVWLMRRV